MKRNKPLQSKTPLKRGGELKRSPLAPRSKKTEKLYREERIPFVKEILSTRPLCEICGRRDSVDVHEKLTRGRSGGVKSTEWLDPDNVMALCRLCHNWIDENKAEAEELGYLIKSHK